MKSTIHGKKARRAQRIGSKFNASVQTGETAISGIFTDFSEYGCFIQTPHFPKIDSVISIYLAVSSQEQIRLQGRVASHRETFPIALGEPMAGVGVEFVEKPEEYVDFVTRFRK
jgi:hypothetical protein